MDYLTLKKAVLSLVPKSLVLKFEYQLRYFSYLSLRGSNYQCNMCDKKLKDFVALEHDRLCPRCGSLQRNRRLYQLLTSTFLRPHSSVLDFSPSRSVHRRLKNKDINYLASDLSGDFNSDVSFDIRAIDAADESYDLIICYHILEHIDDDSKAMQELFRVLKHGGSCLVQTPFKEGEIYENDSITTAQGRIKHFGQEDHLRIYSANGLEKRLSSVGFQVERLDFEEKPDNWHGFAERENVLVCRRL